MEQMGPAKFDKILYLLNSDCAFHFSLFVLKYLSEQEEDGIIKINEMSAGI